MFGRPSPTSPLPARNAWPAAQRIQELPSSSGALPSLPQQNSAPSRQAVEVLQSQIKYFVERIQEAKGASVPGSVPPLQLQAAASSTSEAAGLVASTPREKEILQFISGPGRPQSSRSSERFGARPLSARPASSRPSTAASCSTAGQSAASTAGVLDSLQGRLSLFTLDSVLQQLRDALVDEAEALSADHEYVEVCLREAAEERLALEGVLAARRTGGARPPTPSQGSPEQPSVEDLREYKARLQATWLAMEGVEGGQQQPRAPSRRFAARLRGAVGSEDAVAEPSFRRGGRVVPAQGSSKAGTAAGIMEDLEELFG